jgi:DedD protein
VERRVKERLVGATVLVAAAVILIPEMLSGPKRTGDTTAKPASDEPFKTYTIDLNRSPGATAPQTAPQTAPLEEAAPPPETESPRIATELPPTSAPDSESPAEEPARSAQASPESATPLPALPAQTAAAERSPEPTARPREERTPAARPVTPSQPVASLSSVPTSKGWAVQLGSFASRPTAERMAREFSGSGQAAFVMPVKSGANTLYRVRVGPFADRTAANDALVGIKKRVANAAVVAHP